MSGASPNGRPKPDHSTLRFLAPPAEAGPDGTIQAGHVLEWIDRAGFACAAGWSGSYCVTAFVGDVRFTRPIRSGEIVEAAARVIHTGRASMQVLVQVSTADPTVGAFTPATQCLLVFVAVDAERRPRPVPEFRPTSIADLDLIDRATRRLPLRARIRTAMEEQVYSDAGTAPRTVFRFPARPGDVNHGGVVHGGAVLRWIDEAAHACALGWTRRPTAAVYAGGVHFLAPIPIGHLVEVDVRIISTGERSVHLAGHVRSADPMTLRWATTTRSMSIFVCPDGTGGAGPVPPLPLVTDEDVALDRHARDLIRLRAELDPIPA